MLKSYLWQEKLFKGKKMNITATNETLALVLIRNSSPEIPESNML